MQKRSYDIQGMSCAACAANVERAVKNISGVSDVNVMLMNNRMTLLADENVLQEGVIEDAVSKAGYKAKIASNASKVKLADNSSAQRQKLQLILSVVLTVLLMSISMGNIFSLGAKTSAIVQFLITLAVMFLQRKYFISAFKALVHFNFNMDSLVSIGSLASVVFSLISFSNIEDGMGYEVLMHE
mgnify:CR=1 FL=1